MRPYRTSAYDKNTIARLEMRDLDCMPPNGQRFDECAYIHWTTDNQ